MIGRVSAYQLYPRHKGEKMPQAKSYQVGFLMQYESDDPEFDNWDDAVAQALKITGYLDHAAGIWSSQEKSSKLLAIVYQGEVFKK